MELRTRNVAHGWFDKRIIKWFRKSFNKQQYKNLRLVYLALAEIDSDFREHPVTSLHKTIQTYSGTSERTTYPIMLFLDEIGLAKVETIGAFEKGSILKMYEWDRQDKLYEADKEYFDNILSGKINRSDVRTRHLSCPTDVVHNKNTKVSNSKNDKSSNKDTNVSSKASPLIKKKKFPKIVKKEVPDMDFDAHTDKGSSYQQKHEYTTRDLMLYKELKEYGCTNHRIDTGAYFRTMDAIHELMSLEEQNPYYNSKIVPQDYKDKDWTIDEVVETFIYYLEHDPKKTYKPIYSFLYSGTHVGGRPWSPLVKFHQQQQKDNGTTLYGDEKSLAQKLQKINIKELNANNIKTVIQLLDLYCNGYRIPQQLVHIYNGSPIGLFIEYIKTQQRSTKFKPMYIVGEKFMKDFVTDARNNRTLVSGS